MEANLSQTFRLNPDDFSRQQRKIIVRACIMSALALGVGYVISTKNTGFMSGGVLAIFLPFMLGALGIGMYRSSLCAREAWHSYELVLTNDTILRRANALADITLTRAQIQRVVERPDGGITIHGPSTNSTIFVPTGLDDRGALLARLESWHSLERQAPKVSPSTRNMIAVVASLAVFAAAYLSSDPRIVVPAGLTCGLGLLWCAWYLWQSPQVDARTKKVAWVTVLPALSVLMRVYQVLRG